MNKKNKKRIEALAPEKTASKHHTRAEQASAAEPQLPKPPAAWEIFFRCQRNPIIRSQLLTALMTGTVLVVERIPTVALLDAVLLATASRVYHDAEIVDDYQALLDRTSEEWARPTYTHRVFDSIHGNAANFIVTHGVRSFNCAEEQYIPGMVAGYLARPSTPNYFEEEFVDVEDRPEYKEAKLARKRVA